MKQSDHFRESAERCAQLAERATEDATHDRYKRMEAAWRALAHEQDWLDGTICAEYTKAAQVRRPRRRADITYSSFEGDTTFSAHTPAGVQFLGTTKIVG
jgi:hypothetical protein